MTTLRERLMERFGEEVAESRRVYSWQERIGGRTVELQYDPYNRRLKLFDVLPGEIAELEGIGPALRGGGRNDLVSKLIVYARAGQDGWSELGLCREATIRGFFGDGDDAELWAAYLDPARAEDESEPENRGIAAMAREKKPVEPALPEGYVSAMAKPEDAAEIAALLQETFDDYPTPLDPDLLARAMRERTSIFRLARDPGGRLAACASAEIHHSRRSAELTDCATRPAERGLGLMSFLLRALERDLEARFGITDLYTIARACEAGMNCSFAKLGYVFTGRLTNNCRMPHGFESMNVWCREARRGARGLASRSGP